MSGLPGTPAAGFVDGMTAAEALTVVHSFKDLFDKTRTKGDRTDKYLEKEIKKQQILIQEQAIDKAEQERFHARCRQENEDMEMNLRLQREAQEMRHREIEFQRKMDREDREGRERDRRGRR